MYSITDNDLKKEVVGGKISNATPVKAIKSRGMPSNKTKPFNVCCHTPRTHGIREETTTTTTTSTRGFFFERVGSSHGGVGESRGAGNGQTYKTRDPKSQPTVSSPSPIRCNDFDVNYRFYGRCYKTPIASNVKSFYNMPMRIKSMP